MMKTDRRDVGMAVLGAVLLVLLSSGSLAAQPPSDEESTRPGSTSIEQIASPSPPRESAVIDDDRSEQVSREPVAQVAREDRNAAPPAQLSSAGDRRRSPQLYQGGRTAAPAQALSSPSEGRTGAVAAVEGSDRCDPARRQPNETRRCAQVIETRSAEFSRAEAAPLSPEARLLVEQRNRSSGGQEAARRLASNSADPDDVQDQAIASVVLTQRPLSRPEDEEQDASSEPTEAQAFQALIERVVGNPPPP